MDISAYLCSKQLRALGKKVYKVFCIGQDEAIVRTLASEAICTAKFISFLKAKNASGYQISFSPVDRHNILFFDDVNYLGLNKLNGYGLAPSVIVETSPLNYQAWIVLSDSYSISIRDTLTGYLVKDISADKCSLNQGQPGKLTGFTNTKAKHRLPSGDYPFVKLVHASYRPVSPSGLLIKRISDYLSLSDEFRMRNPLIKSISDYHLSVEFAGDLHRADMAYAINALKLGVDVSIVRSEILSRNLSKKGSIRRQVEYANRTIRKARGLLGWSL
ncbi:hypothetical protein M2404_003860 [Rheinheimera pacifica]|uniref:RepB family DNA primase n=1 Tax=Rheinheimera pacifica TaxID=173990 RepID=UPI0021695D08|nr:RepB family DNA primase [Rheinheimera pacifica]MCS4309488.1 hypothetical protein [Rheinheimera pacifica]